MGLGSTSIVIFWDDPPRCIGGPVVQVQEVTGQKTGWFGPISMGTNRFFLMWYIYIYNFLQFEHVTMSSVWFLFGSSSACAQKCLRYFTHGCARAAGASVAESSSVGGCWWVYVVHCRTITTRRWCPEILNLTYTCNFQRITYSKNILDTVVPKRVFAI